MVPLYFLHKLIEVRCNITFWSYDGTGIHIMGHQWHCQNGTITFCLGQYDQNEVQHDFSGHVMPLAPALASCDVNDIVNGQCIP